MVTKRRADLPVLSGCFPLAIYFTFGSVYTLMPLFHFSEESYGRAQITGARLLTLQSNALLFPVGLLFCLSNSSRFPLGKALSLTNSPFLKKEISKREEGL